MENKENQRENKNEDKQNQTFLGLDIVISRNLIAGLFLALD